MTIVVLALGVIKPVVAVNMRNIDDPSIVANLPIKVFDGALSSTLLQERPNPILFRSPSE